jgi:hypothetical protein
MDRTCVLISPTGEHGRAGAIGAGSQPPTGAEPEFVKTQRRVRQRREASVIGPTPSPERRERANACDGNRGIGPGAMTTTTSVNGTPMTSKSRTLQDKEKDRCANTGLSQEVSLVVPVGTRSDRRQTA